MSSIVATAKAFPEYFYSQEQLSSELRKAWNRLGLDLKIFDRLQKNTKVQSRYLSLPIADYYEIDRFSVSNDLWIEKALQLGETVLRRLFANANLTPEDISLMMFTTVTGIAVPSVEARLMNRLPFSRHLKRVPLFGLGCLAGTAGVARLADYLKGHPQEAVVLLSIELCSLTIQRTDVSLANIVSSGLFGDGAAAVLMVGENHPLASTPHSCHPQVMDSQSIFFPDSEKVMGWDVTDQGFKIVLGPGVPDYARRLRPDLDEFLSKHDLAVADIDHWITHPGGPKVIQALEETLELDQEQLLLAKHSLETIGNLSSASVLIILEETLTQRQPTLGDYGVMLSMGPAFSAELVLLRW